MEQSRRSFQVEGLRGFLEEVTTELESKHG